MILVALARSGGGWERILNKDRPALHQLNDYQRDDVLDLVDRIIGRVVAGLETIAVCGGVLE